MSELEALVSEARRWIGVRETHGSNRGPEVDRFESCLKGYSAQGQSWCMAFVQYCLKQIEAQYQKNSGVFESEHCLTVWNNTDKSRRSTQPKPGAIIIWQHANTSNGHTGIVEQSFGTEFITTIEGNTGPGPGVQRNGDGVYLRTRSIIGEGQMRVLGFIYPF